MLGVANSFNILCSATFSEISTSLLFLELLVESVKVIRFFSRLLPFLFVLAVLSTSRSETSSLVREDLGINQFTIKEKLDKNSPATMSKFGRLSEPPKYNSDFTITKKKL